MTPERGRANAQAQYSKRIRRERKLEVERGIERPYENVTYSHKFVEMLAQLENMWDGHLR